MRWLYSFFLSGWGLPVLAALDSTPFFFFPLGIDAAVMAVTAHHKALFWFYPILTALGSLAGAAVSYLLGMKLGETGIEPFVPKRRLERLKKKVRDGGAVTLAFLDLIPPPFPFTAFVLASGALKVNAQRFFLALTLARLIRFGGESLLALYYGRWILRLLSSELVQEIVWILIIMIFAGSAYSIYRFAKETRLHVRRRRAR
jgi:membrane protein YqaA with SNARE-associated domain